MKRVSVDNAGAEWQICWGVSEPEDALRDHFGLTGPFRATGEFVTFQDPLYRNEKKTLNVYECESDAVVAMAEITASVFAAGVKK